MGDALDRVEGLLVCKVGTYPLVFPAAEVARIADWTPGDAPAAHARDAFTLPARAGRLLEDATFALVVDSLEVHGDPVELLPVPPMLLGAVGGALKGFVTLSGVLCPVLSLADFTRFLHAIEHP